MTQVVKYFCDICKQECFVKDGLGTFAGFVAKVTKDLQPKNIAFEGHYCAICSEKIMNFISESKNAQHNNPK